MDATSFTAVLVYTAARATVHTAVVVRWCRRTARDCLGVSVCVCVCVLLRVRKTRSRARRVSFGVARVCVVCRRVVVTDFRSVFFFSVRAAAVSYDENYFRSRLLSFNYFEFRVFRGFFISNFLSRDQTNKVRSLRTIAGGGVLVRLNKS